MKPKHTKRAEANERNARWAELTPRQQLADLDRRGLTATRQRKRIAAAIAAQSKEDRNA